MAFDPLAYRLVDLRILAVVGPLVAYHPLEVVSLPSPMVEENLEVVPLEVQWAAVRI